jgi:hypothetical protein
MWLNGVGACRSWSPAARRDRVCIATLRLGWLDLWSDTVYVGVMAQEVALIDPDAVVHGVDGYLRVDYARLGSKLVTASD